MAAQQNNNPQQFELKAPTLPTDQERQALKEKIKIAMHKFESEVLLFINYHGKLNEVDPAFANYARNKLDVYKLLREMHKSYESTSCCSTK